MPVSRVPPPFPARPSRARARRAAPYDAAKPSPCHVLVRHPTLLRSAHPRLSPGCCSPDNSAVNVAGRRVLIHGRAVRKQQVKGRQVVVALIRLAGLQTIWSAFWNLTSVPERKAYYLIELHKLPTSAEIS